jgi:hypothetical protein
MKSSHPINSYALSALKSVIATPSPFSAGTILISLVYKNGPNKPVPSAATTNNRPSLSFAKNATSVKGSGFVLFAGRGSAAESPMIFLDKTHTFMTILSQPATVCQWNSKLNFYLTPKYPPFSTKNSTETSFKIALKTIASCKKRTLKKT